LTHDRRLAPGATWVASVGHASVLIALVVTALSMGLPPRANAQFEISEDEPQVKRVEIVGNTAYEDKTLRSILRTRGKSFFRPWRDAPLRSDFLRYDRGALQDFYRRRGFLSARVDSVQLVRGKGSNVVVRFELVEGPRARVLSIDFEGPTADEEQSLRGVIPLQAGGVFDFHQVEASRAAIDSLYAQRGQVTATIRDSVQIMGDDVRVGFQIRPGPQIRLRSIVVEGADKTRPGFVTREVVLKPNQPLARSRLLRSQQRIYNSGFYNDVQFSTGEYDSATNLTDLIVSVRERRLGWVDAGIGVAYAPALNPSKSLDVLRVSGQVGQRNLFRDGVRFVATARLGIRASTKPQIPYVRDLFAGERRADVSLTRDWLAGVRVQGTLGAFAEEVPPDTNQTYPFRAIGASAGLRYDLDYFSRVSLVFQPSRVFSDSTTQLTVDGDPIRSYTSNRVVVAVERDTRRNLFDPRRGTFSAATAEFAGGRFGGTAQFLKVSGSASGYRPWKRGITLAVRGRAGMIFSSTEGSAAATGEAIPALQLIPLNDRFFLGGANSVRGYHDNEIGHIRTYALRVDPQTNDSSIVAVSTPRGGSFLLLANAEVRLRLVGFLGAAVFVDAGNVWEQVEDATWRRIFSLSNGAGYKDMKYAAGVGVRIATPVGPVRLDYGWKLRLARPDEPNTVTGRGAFAFSLGQAF
jgi:outer membrane protein insertion porin family